MKSTLKAHRDRLKALFSQGVDSIELKESQQEDQIIEQTEPITEASEPIAQAETPLPPRPKTVAGLIPFDEYSASVSVREANRGKQENERQMWIEVEDYGAALCSVSNRHKWRPHERLTVIFSGRLHGAIPLFGHKMGPRDARRR